MTGSCTLLRFGDTRLLVDCGLFQGNEETEKRNWIPFPFQPSELNAVVVTHAHLDHTGLLPKLVAEGYTGPIYCTKPTRPLAALVLEDAGELQEEEARYAAKKGFSRHPSPRPLFTSRDAKRVIAKLESRPFDQELEIVPGVHVRIRRAGHLLGAASIEITAKGADGERRTWLFSGDVGRYGVPILKDPEPSVAEPAAVVLESTYGDRLHGQEDAGAKLGEIIARTFARGGSVVIPAFALGRTQDLLYYLSQLAERGAIDPATVFLDSPMAISATEIYRAAHSEHDEDLSELVANGYDPLAPDRFNRCRTVDQSKALNARQTPAVIVAGSGMATGGRVVHHLARLLPDARHTVVFAGYQAAGTRGRAIVEGSQVVAIHGRQVPVAAEIVSLSSLSAHADRGELVRWAQALPGKPQRAFLNHGEDAARKALGVTLAEAGWPRPELPLSGTQVPW